MGRPFESRVEGGCGMSLFSGQYIPSDTERELWSLIGESKTDTDTAEIMRGQHRVFCSMQNRTLHPYYGKLIRARNYVRDFFKILNDDRGAE